MVFLVGEELFRHNGWTQVLLGQGFEPKLYQPVVDNMSDSELLEYLKGFQEHVAKNTSMLPTHDEFLARYCVSKKTEVAMV